MIRLLLAHADADSAATRSAAVRWRLRESGRYLRCCTHRPVALAFAVAHLLPSTPPLSHRSDTRASPSPQATVPWPLTMWNPGPGGPGSPLGPGGPCGPGEPCAPAGPTSPRSPTGPWRPTGPISPRGPDTPGGPIGPGFDESPQPASASASADAAARRSGFNAN